MSNFTQDDPIRSFFNQHRMILVMFHNNQGADALKPYINVAYETNQEDIQMMRINCNIYHPLCVFLGEPKRYPKIMLFYRNQGYSFIEENLDLSKL